MGLLDGTTHSEYYQGNELGNYQFTSLDDIITQFEIAYVGENKIIPKVKRADIAFHAQRGLQEFSFDTFKSIKSQQIELPPTLVMPLPHDYVNYTKISSVDSAGIKHLLYPTNNTNNPFQILQDDSGSYSFPSGSELLTNAGFSNITGSYPDNWGHIAQKDGFTTAFGSSLGIVNGKLMWSYITQNGNGSNGWGSVGVVYQAVDVSDHTYVDISADGVTADIDYTNVNATTGTAVGTVRFGLTTQDPSLITNLSLHEDFSVASNATLANGNPHPSAGQTFPKSPFFYSEFFDLGYVEWTGTESSTKTFEGINVSSATTVYAVALSFIEASTGLTNHFPLVPSGTTSISAAAAAGVIDTPNINSIDNLTVTNTYASNALQTTVGNEKNSSTWNNYKSITPSENNNDDYEDDTYWPYNGERYGLNPSHAQVNGSFYIDQRLGRIHFSSNISGKTVILDYISDSLGTDGEMQVHKFAEEAMYKWIAYAILSTSSLPIHQQLAPRFKKEKFAATRQAKLRLSNIKLEELTQILRGKSKQIKH